MNRAKVLVTLVRHDPYLYGELLVGDYVAETDRICEVLGDLILPTRHEVADAVALALAGAKYGIDRELPQYRRVGEEIAGGT